jgi:hypothetical protein
LRLYPAGCGEKPEARRAGDAAKGEYGPAAHMNAPGPGRRDQPFRDPTWSDLMGLFRRKKPETDVPMDTAVAWSRDQGGEPDERFPDRNSTTGTTPSGEFVGRASGDDPGDVEPSGAERRAQARAQSADDRKE